MSEHPSTQKRCRIRRSPQRPSFVGTSLYNTRQPLATLLNLLKSFELLKTLRRANECNSSIENIGVGKKREIFGAIEKEVGQSFRIRKVDIGRNIKDTRQKSKSMSVESSALQKKMLCGFIALGADTCSDWAVDKMMVIAMSAKITKTSTELG